MKWFFFSVRLRRTRRGWRCPHSALRGMKTNVTNGPRRSFSFLKLFFPLSNFSLVAFHKWSIIVAVLVVVVIIIHHIIRSPRVDFNYDMKVREGENAKCAWVEAIPLCSQIWPSEIRINTTNEGSPNWLQGLGEPEALLDKSQMMSLAKKKKNERWNDRNSHLTLNIISHLIIPGELLKLIMFAFKWNFNSKVLAFNSSRMTIKSYLKSCEELNFET